MFAAPEAFPPASAQWSTHIPDFSRPDHWLSHNLHFDHPVHLLSKPAWVQSYRAHPNILIFYSIADRSPGDAPYTFDLIFRSNRFSVFLSVSPFLIKLVPWPGYNRFFQNLKIHQHQYLLMPDEGDPDIFCR